MPAYYNELDPYAAQWLRNLVVAGHITPGDVDERSIEDVTPDDLKPYTQCHFFAGIGVWSYALRRSGIPDDYPVWTGSCPCQPFSAAGQGAGFADERHLWPAFHHLIRERRPVVVYGEQVASKDADAWIDLVQDDLEGMGYAVGALAFPSAGVGAPHIRDRMYWVADANYAGPQRRRAVRQRSAECAAGPGGVAGGMADAERADLRGKRPRSIEGTAPRVQGQDGQRERVRPDVGASGSALAVGLADTSIERRDGLDTLLLRHEPGRLAQDCAEIARRGPSNGLWRDADWIGCTDGKWRPVEPGTFPLAHGDTARVGRLRAYGNAINATAAEEFIRAHLATNR